MFSKFFKIFFVLIIFYHGPVYSNIQDINKKFNHKDLSHYFSGIISYNQQKNSEALKYFNLSKNLKNDHIPYLEQYIKILIHENKIKTAIKELKKNQGNKNVEFFESYLLLLIDSILNKDFTQSEKYLSKMNKLGTSNTFEYIIHDSLKNYLYLFKNKVKFPNKNKLGNLNLINNAFEDCYIGSEETEKSFLKLIDVKDADYSRYKFFYATYLAQKNQENKVKIYLDNINDIRSNLLVSQLKSWIENENLSKKKNIFSCQKENHILSEFFYLIANLYTSEENYFTSNFYLNISLFLNPDFIYNYSLIVENFLANENFLGAEKILTHFNKNDKIYFWYKTKKKTQIISNKYGNEEAFKYLNLEFKKIKNPSKKALYDFGNLMKSFGKHELAIEYYNQVLDGLQKNSILYAEILYRRGGSYERIGKHNEADRDLIESLELDPDDAYVLNYLAYSWLERNYKIDLAIQMLEKAYKKESDSPYILDSIGWAYYLIGDFIKAEMYLKKAVQLMPNDPIVNDHYGDILWNLNRKMQARYHWMYVQNLEETEQDMLDKIDLKLLYGLEKL
tara:strand:+ start:4583 stop:6271 length:1689 start_codon:yes stop_codon:yes gene_type:complete